MTQTAVVAVGGNSLIKDSQHRSVPDQYAAAAESMHHIADMIAAGWKVVVTHGNGPQVGFILRRSELARGELHEVPLDSCGADTQGAIGYMFQKALHNEFKRRAMTCQAATVVTQVLVDRNDPAFQKPSKPIGSFMGEAEARGHMDREGWSMVEDAGRGWRRVVASPKPQAIVERDAIQSLIDKDYASALLANSLPADVFIISTAVEKVALNYNQPNQRWLDRLSLAEAHEYLAAGHFLKGSMGPKIEAIVSFLERGGQRALITNPENLGRALKGETGTWIVPG